MDFLSDVARKTKQAGKDALNKAGDVKDTVKYKMDIHTKEEFIDRQYASIGKRVFEAEKDKENTPYEEVFLIKRTFEEIEEIKAEMARLKGMDKCPSCGASVEAGGRFCPICGAKMTEE